MLFRGLFCTFIIYFRFPLSHVWEYVGPIKICSFSVERSKGFRSGQQAGQWKRIALCHSSPIRADRQCNEERVICKTRCPARVPQPRTISTINLPMVIKTSERKEPDRDVTLLFCFVFRGFFSAANTCNCLFLPRSSRQLESYRYCQRIDRYRSNRNHGRKATSKRLDDEDQYGGDLFDSAAPPPWSKPRWPKKAAK